MYNGYVEAEVVWPDLKNPVTTRRPLSITDGHGGVTAIGTIDLIVLVNMCLYVVAKDAHGLKAGDLLSRNFELTRRRMRDQQNLAEQMFLRYTSIYDARRGIGRIEGRYRRLEIPELRRWSVDADWLIRASWTLTRTQPERDANFIWVADRRIHGHRKDRADFKVAALQLFDKVSTLRDRLGRRNTPSLPLQLSAADRLLEARTQEVRGIGRRMDWRAVVLEHYIDQLERECRAIRRAAQDALTSKSLFGDERTTKTLRTRANRMGEYAGMLREIKVRTFTRAFAHIARELDEICDLLHDAAERRSPDRLDRVRELLRRIFDAMVLAEVHWRIQEMLLVVADHHHRRAPLTPDQIRLYVQETEDLVRLLTDPDPVTGERVGTTFTTDVVPVTHGQLVLAKLDLLNSAGVEMSSLYGHLKAAASPI